MTVEWAQQENTVLQLKKTIPGTKEIKFSQLKE